ncbi:porin [Shimwellia blattae]|uniref:Outer membrane protein n=1 Tax=Shimwellia blattae (strain ATCC 29907 / DSM 4481 / JCM 1650 / NBRC 105725 / CDC 9005-74) TaxID=630626 RepID=I2BBC3_SHIBC|nr:porin [Shimwellia blattae]AFJ47827.1 outer membrane protein [Shimwellia blattae DSM 4481 = NBRC 105725]GAB79601.1 hypothetical protein YedS [Shimwellia blattae DSM 4481 = NBRC 105725]VDY65324.1 Outer membrane porin protein OmpD precursor [Shimwellia blattae]VEC24239.1 Outer membrane porin protein OmpD precursor [Shimwellia blattae]
MKYNKLAVVVSSLLLVSAGIHAAEIYNKDGNKLDLYGKVDARHQFSDDKGADGDQTYVRLGFRGETQINDLLTGYGQWEYNMQANNTEDSGNQAWTRLAFAGLRAGDYGSADFGRNYGVNYDIEAWTDLLPVFGGDSYTRTDNFMLGRGNSMATYRNNGFFGLVDGLNIALQYQAKNEERSLNKENGDGFGVSTTYEFDGFAIGGSYANSNRSTLQKKTENYDVGDRAEAWNVGMKYDANNIYLAATYAETRNMTAYSNGNTTGTGPTTSIANKTQNIEMVAQYQFDFGLRPSVAYLQSKGKHLNTARSSEDLVKYIEVGSSYYFNKNLATYVDYKINLLDKNDLGIKTDNVVGAGIVYQF